VVVFGASGGVGRFLVQFAIERGYAVFAVSRRGLDVDPNVRVVEGDVNDPTTVRRAIEGQDVVLSALGIRRTSPSPFSPLASPPDFTEATARSIVAAMREHGVLRVIAVSASGIGDSRPGLNWMMRFMIARTNVRYNYEDLERMEVVYRESGRDWMCVRPTGLKDGPVTGKVALIPGFPFLAGISRADVARWMVDHVEADLSADRTPIITEARS
jgi:putative NADH-flavin reductase